jgi:DNA-binding LacI/PurR family transcriptional regulator
MTSRITLRDVARQTGCSIATVSLALRDHPRLLPATRERVRRAARELGYRPDPLLASIAASRWRGRPAATGSTLAFIDDGKTEGLAGMTERAGHLGYRLETFAVKDYPDGRRLSDVLYHRGIVGVVVGQLFTPEFCEYFDWSHFASVAVSEGNFRPPIHLVMPNHFRAVQTAWDRALQMGFRRIGLLLFDQPEALDFHDRRAAFMERQLQVPASRRLPVLAIRPHSHDPADDAEALRSIDVWMRRHGPDVVLGFNDGLIWALRDAGWRVPEQVAFISLWKNHPEPRWPGVILSPDEIGRRAVDWVDSLLRSGERGLPTSPATMEIEGTWQEGTPGFSTVPVRKKCVCPPAGV